MEETKCYCGHTTYCDCGPEIDGFKHIVKVIPKEEILANRSNAYEFIDIETLEEAAERLSELQEGTYTPQHKITYKHGFEDGTKWQQEQILQFLYSEIIERRPYSSSKMCEVVIEFIEQLNTKK